MRRDPKGKLVVVIEARERRRRRHDAQHHRAAAERVLGRRSSFTPSMPRLGEKRHDQDNSTAARF